MLVDERQSPESDPPRRPFLFSFVENSSSTTFQPFDCQFRAMRGTNHFSRLPRVFSLGDGHGDTTAAVTAASIVRIDAADRKGGERRFGHGCRHERGPRQFGEFFSRG